MIGGLVLSLALTEGYVPAAAPAPADEARAGADDDLAKVRADLES